MFLLFKSKPKLHAEARVLRHDEAAMVGVDAGEWALIFVSIIVVVIIVAALFGPLNTALTSLAGNQTSVGPVFQSIVPIVLVLGLLLAVVAAAFGTFKKKL